MVEQMADRGKIQERNVEQIIDVQVLHVIDETTNIAREHDDLQRVAR